MSNLLKLPAAGLIVLATAVGVAALLLRLAPGGVFAVGPLSFTPATALLALASALGWVALIGSPGASGMAGAGLSGAAERPSRFEVGVGILVALGAVLRFAHLGQFPLNGDEHLFVNSSHAESVAGVWAGVLQHHHPPANFYLLHLMQSVSVEPLWLRLPSLMAGLYLVWISARLARTWVGPREGLIVAFIVAFGPPFVELSRVCRNYSPALAMMVTALYFFARYFRERRGRDLLWFSLFECLAILWLYSVIVTLFAVNVVLFASLALGRRPLIEWLRPFIAQLPVALLALLLYVAHIRVVSGTEMSAHSLLYHEENIFRTPSDYLAYLPLPVMLLFQYIFAGVAGLAAFALAAAGAVRLCRTGRGTITAVTLVTLALAYGFRWARLLPFTGNRQSLFVAPLLLVLVAAGVSSLLILFSDLRRRPGETGDLPETAAPAPGHTRAGLLAGAAFLLLFLNLSLGVAEGTVFLDRQEELPTKWEDLERVVSVLRERSQPGDVILVSYQGLCAYQAYLNRSAMPYAPGEPATLESRGLRFHYSPESGWFFTPDSIVRSYLDARRTSFKGAAGSVWVARGSGWPWEKPVRDWFHHEFPEVRIDDALAVETGGWLLRAVAADLDTLGPRVAERDQFYAEDFIRSQISRENRRSPDYFLSPSGRE